MRKVLFIGDDGCDSGFSKCTRYTCQGLQSLAWDIVVLGINYRVKAVGGNRPPDHGAPYPVWPAKSPESQFLGVERIDEVMREERPDVIIIQNDTWNVPKYMEELRKFNYPVVGLIAVDGKYCQGLNLNELRHAIFWTKFAEQEAREGGMTISSAVVPLGVDREVFFPMDRVQARQALGLPSALDHAFIVGNMNRNQPRKRLDLTIKYFGEWIRSRQITDAYLYLHVAPTGERWVNCQWAAQKYGLGVTPETSRLILEEPGVYRGFTEVGVRTVLNAFNVYVSTSVGEGWGLPAMEAMACGVPCVLPAHSAYAEWAQPARLVRCSGTEMNPAGVEGKVVDEEDFINALDEMYRDHVHYTVLQRAGLALTARPEYDWKNIAAAVNVELEKVCPWLAV